MARNMYALSIKQWNPFEGCEHDCEFCKTSFQAQAKRRGKGTLCYQFVPHQHRERLGRHMPRTGYGQYIFTCSNGDIAFCEPAYLDEILDVVQQWPDRTFLLQTKDPRVFLDIERRRRLPRNVLAGITLETNRDAGYDAISKAPPPSQRYAAFLEVRHPQKMVTIEPVLDFDLPALLEWVLAIHPRIVWLGYNSKKKPVLPEPDLDKVKELYWQLGRHDIVVHLKTIREAVSAQTVAMPKRPGPRKKSAVHADSEAKRTWDDRAVRRWAGNASPGARLALRLLSSGEILSTRELNEQAVARGLPGAGGAIVGGINAWATRSKLPHPVDKVGKSYRMKRALRPMFVKVLGDQ